MLYGAILLLTMGNIFNTLESKELSEQRGNYGSIQATLMAFVFGFIVSFAGMVITIDKVRIEGLGLIIISALCTLIAALTFFESLRRINPVDAIALKSVVLPMTLILDLILGNISLTPTNVMGSAIITITVITTIRRSGVLNKGNKDKMLGILLVFVSRLFATLDGAVIHSARTEYSMDIFTYQTIKTIVAIVVLLIIGKKTKEIYIKSIKKNIKSHTKAGSFSALQQLVGVYVLGYIPNSYYTLIKQAMAYLIVPLSKTSKLEEIKDVDPKAHYIYIGNLIGTAMIVMI